MQDGLLIIIIKFNILYYLFDISDCHFPAGTRIYNLKDFLFSNVSRIM